ncbi:hypothetical protein WJX77_004941 [Trebouxia sp. C0004]
MQLHCIAPLRAQTARSPITQLKKPCFARATGRRTAVAVAEAHSSTRFAQEDPRQQLQLALKEWAVTCAALGQGDQTIILRKGGIREPAFRPAASTFLLFPTSFHSNTRLLRPVANVKYQQELAFDQKTATHLTIKHIASLTGCWTTFDPFVLSALSDHHVWTEEFLSTRLKWKPKQPITVMELRCSQLQQPLVTPTQDSYWGCFSWIDVEQGVTKEQLTTAEAVIDNSDYQGRQQQVRRALGQLDDCTEVVVK